MANEQNLTQAGRLKGSSEEAKRIGAIGGIKSGEAKRKRKTLKEELLLMLEDETVQQSLCASILNQAIKKGDVRAFEVIRDSIGEKETEKIETITNLKVDLED